MKYRLILIVTLLAGSLGATAQTNGVNYLLAAQLRLLVGKIGLSADSASTGMLSFKKMPETKASEVGYKSDMYNTEIIFQKDENNKIKIILCSMPASSLNTAKSAISLMGMIATGTQAPPGYTAYATPKYAAFLNPELTTGWLSLVLVPGTN